MDSYNRTGGQRPSKFDLIRIQWDDEVRHVKYFAHDEKPDAQELIARLQAKGIMPETNRVHKRDVES